MHRKGDFGNDVDGMKGDAVKLLNGDAGPREARFVVLTRMSVLNCVNVWFYCVTSLAVLFGGTAVGVKTDALVVSLLLVKWGVCCWFFRCKQAARRRRLQRVPESARRAGPMNSGADRC